MTVDTGEKNADVSVIKPLRSTAYEKEVKAVSGSKAAALDEDEVAGASSTFNSEMVSMETMTIIYVSKRDGCSVQNPKSAGCVSHGNKRHMRYASFILFTNILA